MNKRRHAFTSAKADGGDATLVRPSNWNGDHDLGIELTNRTGGVLASGDIVALSAANDESVLLDDTADSRRKFLVSMAAPADLALGLFTDQGAWTMKVDSGGATRGNYLAKSATAKSLKDTGRAAATTPPLPGDIAIALSTVVGAGTIVGCFLPASTGAFLKGADIASAAALAPSAGATYHHVTGTTTITSIASAGAGHLLILEFDGAVTVTHNATSLILQKGVNYVTEAGDVLVFVSEGSGNWRQVSPFHAILTYLAIGPNPASIGALRLPNNTALYARNAANSGDLQLLSSDASDRGVLGAGVTNVRVVNQLRCDIDAAGRLVVPVGASKWAT